MEENGGWQFRYLLAMLSDYLGDDSSAIGLLLGDDSGFAPYYSYRFTLTHDLEDARKAAALDPDEWRYVCDLAGGLALLLVSHDVEFCARYADFVSMFFDGQILTTESPRRFFGGNSFYTTAANRMSRHVFSMAVTGEDVIELYQRNREETHEA